MKRFNLLILISSVFLLSTNFQSYKSTDMDLKIVQDFIESINTANIDKLYDLMSNDHVFIDSRGNSMVGNDKIKIAWIGYLDLFPDYKIEVTDTLQSDSIIVLLGYASGTYKTSNKKVENENRWKVPASWKAIVVDRKIKLWQVYADNSVAIEIINKNK